VLLARRAGTGWSVGHGGSSNESVSASGASMSCALCFAGGSVPVAYHVHALQSALSSLACSRVSRQS
jgi:hypothetical protein